MSKKNSKTLAEFRPDLLKEWDYEKNKDLSPDQVTYGSQKKVWWKCNTCGYEWQASIANRTINNHKGTNCPVCSGNKIKQGYNDLATLRPDLTIEWNYEKNKNLLPSQVALNRKKKVWWKCNTCGHEWQASCNSRVGHHTGCPVCGILKRSKARSTAKNGNSLQEKSPEIAKQWDYEKNGNTTPSQVNYRTHKKAWWKCKYGHSWQATIASRETANCPICAGKQVLTGYNDLATTNPEIVKEWDYEKNQNLLPTQVSYGSNKKVWWKCPKGHEYQSKINSRAIHHTGCPICANIKVLKDYNDLATLFPQLTKEWDYEKNDILPTQVVPGSAKKVWWKCKFYGHSWKAPIRKRANQGTGCPICYQLSHRKKSKGKLGKSRTYIGNSKINKEGLEIYE